MIKITCFTNLDLRAEQWPEELPERPIVGDIIQSAVERNGFRLQLKVVRVRWVVTRAGNWRCEVELSDWLDRSVAEFYEWYAPKVGSTVGAFI